MKYPILLPPIAINPLIDMVFKILLGTEPRSDADIRAIARVLWHPVFL